MKSTAQKLKEDNPRIGDLSKACKGRAKIIIIGEKSDIHYTFNDSSQLSIYTGGVITVSD
jgi:hypothetical protein